MRPNDVIQVKMATGTILWWRIKGVYLGGLHQESVVELEPLGQTHNTEGRTIVPAQLLDIACESPLSSIQLFRPALSPSAKHPNRVFASTTAKRQDSQNNIVGVTAHCQCGNVFCDDVIHGL